MTEAEWLTTTDPPAMLEFVRGTASDRKFRLFACGSCRADELAWGDAESRGAWTRMEEEVDQLPVAIHRDPFFDDQNGRVEGVRIETAYFAARETARLLAERRGGAFRDFFGSRSRRKALALIIRDVLGNPFRPVSTDPSWLTPTALLLAQGIYADRAFDRLSILADALQDAGCDSADLLNHLRGGGPHVLGCWALDVTLGKS